MKRPLAIFFSLLIVSSLGACNLPKGGIPAGTNSDIVATNVVLTFAALTQTVPQQTPDRFPFPDHGTAHEYQAGSIVHPNGDLHSNHYADNHADFEAYKYPDTQAGLNRWQYLRVSIRLFAKPVNRRFWAGPAIQLLIFDHFSGRYFLLNEQQLFNPWQVPGGGL